MFIVLILVSKHRSIKLYTNMENMLVVTQPIIEYFPIALIFFRALVKKENYFQAVLYTHDDDYYSDLIIRTVTNLHLPINVQSGTDYQLLAPLLRNEKYLNIFILSTDQFRPQIFQQVYFKDLTLIFIHNKTNEMSRSIIDCVGNFKFPHNNIYFFMEKSNVLIQINRLKKLHSIRINNDNVEDVIQNVHFCNVWHSNIKVYALNAPPMVRIYQLENGKFVILGSDAFFLDLFIKHYKLNYNILTDSSLMGSKRIALKENSIAHPLMKTHKQIITDLLVTEFDIKFVSFTKNLTFYINYL